MPNLKKKSEPLTRGKEVPVKKTVYLSAKEEDNDREPALFFSEDAHYSIIKAARVLGVKTFSDEGNKVYPKQCPITQDGVWPDGVPSHSFDSENPKSGEVKVDKLKELVEFFVQKDYPVIIVLNVGSTWKGAYDDVPAVNEMLVELGKTYPNLWKYEFNYTDSNGKVFTDVRRRFWCTLTVPLGALAQVFRPFSSGITFRE